MKPTLLDLFCGAGGAAKGYQRAGFYVVGVDINPQPNYCGDEFIQGDALEVCAEFGALFDAIHASPPCQKHTTKPANWGRKRKTWTRHADLIPETRRSLDELGVVYVIENVFGAPLKAQLMLCGTMFSSPSKTGVRLIKHRYFESNIRLPMSPAACNHSVKVYNPWEGKGRSAKKLREAQGTPWIPMGGGASRALGVTGDLFNAIPPAYTEYIGRHLMRVLESERAKP